VANIARKVDRLERAANGAPAARDENLLDTATDLLVYCLKYQTYLSDQDAEVAASLFGTTPPPYSDGRGGFEALLGSLDLAALDDTQGGLDLAEASAAVVVAFTELERCFDPGSGPASVGERLKRAVALTAAAVEIVACLLHEAPHLYRDYLAEWGEDA
jgi:hypothetical protein